MRKKIMALMMALTLALAYTGCSNNNDQNTTDNHTPMENMGQAAGDMADGIGQGAQDMVEGMADGMKAMADGIMAGGAQLMDVEENMFVSTYGIDKSKYADVRIMASKEDGVEEIILIQAKDEANLEEAKADLEKRKETILASYKSTNSDMYAVAEKAVIKTRGNYAALIVAENTAQAEKAFDSLKI